MKKMKTFKTDSLSLGSRSIQFSKVAMQFLGPEKGRLKKRRR